MSKTRKLLVDKRKWRRQKVDHVRETRYFISPLVSCARQQATMYCTVQCVGVQPQSAVASVIILVLCSA